MANTVTNNMRRDMARAYAFSLMVSAPASSVPWPRSSRVYYGWPVVLVAALAMVGTLPGRTQGLGLITEPLLLDLGLSRVTYAQLNFWATILGAGGAIGIGRAIDRLGSRVVLTVVALALGAIVVGMSRTTGVTDLAVWLTLTRAVGQSALSVVAIAIVGHWFVTRVDRAMAVFSVVLSVGFMLAFPLVGWLVQTSGWRAAWMTIGVALVAGLAPLAWLVVRRSPEACGLEPDGAREPATTGETTGMHWRNALATPAFWLFATGTALYGLVASGIGLFNESILAERGFGADVYYQTLVVTAITALAGNGLGGWLTGRLPLLTLLSFSLGTLAAGVLALPFVGALWQVMVWAVAMGLGGGLMMVLFFSVWPRVFGRRHLGVIQGSAQALTVLASAVGPWLLAWCVESTGSYQSAFFLLAAAITFVGLAALITRLPATHTS
jgi:MFS family permease